MVKSILIKVTKKPTIRTGQSICLPNIWQRDEMVRCIRGPIQIILLFRSAGNKWSVWINRYNIDFRIT